MISTMFYTLPSGQNFCSEYRTLSPLPNGRLLNGI